MNAMLLQRVNLQSAENV